MMRRKKMAKDILGIFGPERSIGGGGMNQGRTQRDVNNYQPPKGPTNITETKAPGLHGDNFDYCGSQERDSLRGETSGSVGLHGSTDCCTQGKH
jgi:hypothetical protein